MIKIHDFNNAIAEALGDNDMFDDVEGGELFTSVVLKDLGADVLDDSILNNENLDVVISKIPEILYPFGNECVRTLEKLRNAA